MRKGYSAPFILLFIFLFTLVPVTYWLINNNSTDANVKGTATTKDTSGTLLINVSSTEGVWDLVEYLCVDMEECSEAPNSGAKIETISGGVASEHEILISYQDSWESFRYLKIVAKPGWGSKTRAFYATLSEESRSRGSTILYFEDSEVKNALIIPLEAFKPGMPQLIAGNIVDSTY